MKRFDVMASEGTGEVLTGYKHYMIVHLQGDEADPVFDLIDAGEIAEAMQYLSQWDYGEYEEGTTAPPWGEMDIRYHMGEQVMYTNRGVGYAGLVYREKEERKMSKFDLSLNDTSELRDLISNNPELPLLIFAGEEAWTGEHTYSQANTSFIRIDELTLYDDMWVNRDGLEDMLNDHFCDTEEYEDMPQDEYEKMIRDKVNRTEFVRAIVIYVG